MNTGKVYFDSDGNERTIWQMIKYEPEWVANRLQEGERAIEKLNSLPNLDNEQLKKIEEVLSARFLVEVKDDPDFTAFARAIPDKHWSKYDLSAVRLGWEVHKLSNLDNLEVVEELDCNQLRVRIMEMNKIILSFFHDEHVGYANEDDEKSTLKTIYENIKAI